MTSCSFTVPGGQAGSEYLSVMAAIGKDNEETRRWIKPLKCSGSGVYKKLDTNVTILLGVLAVPSRSVLSYQGYCTPRMQACQERGIGKALKQQKNADSLGFQSIDVTRYSKIAVALQSHHDFAFIL